MRRKKLVFADVTYELLRADGSVALETKILREVVAGCLDFNVIEVRETAHHNGDAVSTADRADFLGRFF